MSVGAKVSLMLTVALFMGCAQYDARSGLTPQREIEQLKKNQAQIQKDIAEVKKLLQQRAFTPARLPVSRPENIRLDGISFLGKADAPITIVEFTDYHCPFCRRHAKNTLPILLKQYVDTGKVRYGIRDFPLESLHPKAFKLAEAALCAGDQGKYWNMHDQLMKGSRNADPDDLANSVLAAGLDAVEFSACVDSNRHASQIRASLASGFEIGVRGTPYFFIGTIDKEETKRLTIIVTLRGAQPYSVFKSRIEDSLRAAVKKSNNESK